MSNTSFDHESIVPDNIDELVAGNVPPVAKLRALRMQRDWTSTGMNFADSIAQRIRIAELNILEQDGMPSINRALQVVNKIEVQKDMVQNFNTVHGGCMAFLIECCSALSILIMDGIIYGGEGRMGLGQTLNVMLHAPAPLGVQLKIITTTMSIGKRTKTSRTEIWDLTSNRLVASGVHMRADSSMPFQPLRGRL